MNDRQPTLSVSEQLDLLKRGVVDLISEEDLKARLETGKQLRVKLGADPTRPDLHLGHAVILRKMRQFQDLGHKVIMLIGDFTATIGDPTGKSKTRPPLTLEEARANAQSYLQQCKIILRQEPDVLEVRYNSEWLEKLGYKDIIQLASRYTVARIMERDDFKKRFENGVPISVHELLYPLTQGYDSVALEADVELGGTDQLFNNLVGRALQRDYDQAPQIVMTLPLLVGTDGTEKMSKSLDNYIGLTERPEIIYEKLMRIPDNLLVNYFTLLTDLGKEEIKIVIESGFSVSHQVLAILVTNWIYDSGNFKPDFRTLKDTDSLLYSSIVHPSDNIINILRELLNNNEKTISSLSIAIKILKDAINYGISYEIDNLDNYAEFLDSMESMRNSILVVNSETNNLIRAISGSDGVSSEPKKMLENALKNSETQSIRSKNLLNNAREIVGHIHLSIQNTIASTPNSIIKAIEISSDARNRYRSVARGGIPDDLPEVRIAQAELNADGQLSVARLVALAGLEPSNGAARKLIQNRGLKIGGEVYSDPQGSLSLSGGLVLQKGKDKFVKAVLEG